MDNEFVTIRITKEAHEALQRLTAQLTAELKVPVNLTYAASVAIMDTVARLEEKAVQA